MKRVKQFKLTNNDEIVCEVQSWPDEDTDEIIIKKALKIVSVEDYQRGIRFFALRPWMAFQDDPENLHSLNISHVIVTSDPTAPMLKYYNTCLKAIKGDLAKGTTKRKGLWASLDEVNEQTKHLTDEEVDDWLDEKYGRFAEDDVLDSDSSTSNIIKVRPKGTVH